MYSTYWYSVVKDSKCSVNYIKNSVILEISLQEKITNIEKSEEYTI